MPTERCSVRIYGYAQPFGGAMCSKTAKVQVNGRHYCAIHDPAAVLRRRQKADEKYNAERESANQKNAAHKEMQRRADCYPDLLSALQSALTILTDSVGDFDYDKAIAAIQKATGND